MPFFLPRSGARMQPTPQAVGRKWDNEEPQRGERKIVTQFLKAPSRCGRSTAKNGKAPSTH
jgi:hypothetical protein